MTLRRWHSLALIWQSHQKDFIWGVLIGSLALVLRLPYLQLIPSFASEGLEVLWGWQIAIGQHLPLTNVDTYYGPIFPYLMALLFRLLGPHLFLARDMTVGFGTLTAVAAYWLGSRMFNRKAGIVAGVLTATAPYLIILSHYGWSNSLTPFFTILAVGVFYIGVEKHREVWLAVSGFLAALMLQTHPLTIVVIVGMAAWVLLRRDMRSQLRRRAVYVAIALFLVGYAPMLVANLPSDVPLERAAASHSYAFVPTANPSVYLERLGLLGQRVALGLVGQTVRGGAERTAEWVIGSLVALAALVFALRRGRGLLVSIPLASLILLPLILPSYTFELARYLVYLLPFLFIAIGGAIAELGAWLDARLTAYGVSGFRRTLAAGVFGLAVLVLASVPLFYLNRYYDVELAEHRTNQPLIDFGNTLEALGGCQNELWMQQVEPELENRNPSAWFIYHSLRYFLTMHRCNLAVTNPERITTRLEEKQQPGWLLTLARDQSDYSHSFHLEQVETLISGDVPADNFVLYRVIPNKP